MDKIYEIFNFDNIGGKIKNLAKWSCWITILLIWIAAPIAFIVLVADDWTAYLWWIPIASAVVGPVVVWIDSWAMYAFGEFVEDTHAMRNKETPVVKIETEAKKQTKEEGERNAIKREKAGLQKTVETISVNSNTPQQKEEPQKLLLCPECGEDLGFMGWSDEELKETVTCPFCGKKIDENVNYYIDITCPNCNEKLSFLANETNAYCPWCDAKINLK